jgi:hypothetical protein
MTVCHRTFSTPEHPVHLYNEHLSHEMLEEQQHLDVLDDVGRLANVLVGLMVIDDRDQRLACRVHVAQAAQRHASHHQLRYNTQLACSQ